MRLASTPQQAKLAELISARDGLVRDKIALQNQAKNVTLPLLKRQHKKRLDQIERYIEQVDTELATIIAADPELARRHEIISSIAGVGIRTADQLVATMPELGALDPKQAASLAGLAPVARQSGQWKGRSFIQGGEGQRKTCAVHAGPRRRALQSRSQGKISKPHRVHETGSSSDGRRQEQGRRKGSR